MTPRQIEKVKKKIADIKRALATEKRKFGCFDDSRGFRYLPVAYFIQLKDYRGGHTYLRWFSKNFPDDGGYPDFLFEWTIILFKCGKTKEAEKKAFETFCANTYLFDRFFGRPILAVDKWEGSNLSTAAFVENFGYSSKEPDLADFSKWLDDLTSTSDFINNCDKYVEIYKRLVTEADREVRHRLIMQAKLLLEFA